MKEQKEIPIAYIFFWIAFILLIIIVVWRAFGSSPTIEALSLGLATFGAGLTWFGWRAAHKTDLQHLEQIKQHSEQAEILKDIRNILMERLK